MHVTLIAHAPNFLNQLCTKGQNNKRFYNVNFQDVLINAQFYNFPGGFQEFIIHVSHVAVK